MDGPFVQHIHPIVTIRKKVRTPSLTPPLLPPLTLTKSWLYDQRRTAMVLQCNILNYSSWILLCCVIVFAQPLPIPFNLLSCIILSTLASQLVHQLMIQVLFKRDPSGSGETSLSLCCIRPNLTSLRGEGKLVQKYHWIKHSCRVVICYLEGVPWGRYDRLWHWL